MSNFLISTLPATGHVNPFLKTVANLVSHGHNVKWHTGSEVSEKVKATGADFIQMVHTNDIVEKTRMAESKKGIAAINETMISLFVNPMKGQLEDYKEIIRSFPADVLIVDMCSLGAMMFNKLGGPVWASVGINPFRTSESPTYGSGKMPPDSYLGLLNNKIANWIGEHIILNKTTKAFYNQSDLISPGIVKKDKTVFEYLLSPYLHLQGTTPSFEFPYKNIPKQVHFVGPMLPPQQTDKNLLPKWWDELKNGKSVVHVTQGTVATDENELILPTIKAFANENVIVIVTTNNPDKLKGLPSNIIVDRFIPHSLLLPYVKVMITNGGYNGVKEALANGVPLIVAGESEDKPEVASRVAYSGAGINLKTGNPEPNQLKQAVLEILNNPSYKEKAKMIKKEFIEYDSSNLALSLLEKLANTKKPVY